MTHKVLIDNDIHGWAQNNESRIRKEYEKVLHVGEKSTPPPDSSDKVIATLLSFGTKEALLVLKNWRT